METKLSPALMSDDDDLERLCAQRFGIRRWIKAHISQPLPVHRYAGILTIKGQSLVFRGMDVRERKDFYKIVPLENITKISLGLDGYSEGNHNGSFVAGEPEPLVIRYRQNGTENTNYFTTNFPGLSRRVDGNRYWYKTIWRETLKVRINRLRLERALPSFQYSEEPGEQRTMNADSYSGASARSFNESNAFVASR